MVKWFYNSKLAKWLTPLGTCHTITLGCFVLTEKSKEEVSKRLEMHEETHARQFNELVVLGLIIFGSLACICPISWWWIIPSMLLFYVWYGIEWVVRFIIALCKKEGKNAWHTAYKGLAFEREAIDVSEHKEGDRYFGWVRYYKKKGVK